jgi:nucleotide-binding universal stress UspA family protein
MDIGDDPMVMERETPPQNRHAENKGCDSNVVPLRPKPYGSGFPRRLRPDSRDAPAGDGQAIRMSPLIPGTTGLPSEADAFALFPPALETPESVIDKATIPSWIKGPPKRILLATDLSFRCERALDRAAALSAQWPSTLVVVHVLNASDSSLLEAGPRPSWRPADPHSLTWKTLLADVGAVARKATLLIRDGDPAEAIARTAEAEHCDLIVVGIAQDTFFGRVFVHRTIDRLLRRSRVPLLIVKGRPRRPYHHIVVATDFSEASRHALEAAARIFPERKLTLFHAYEARFSGLMMNAEAHRRAYRGIAMEECQEFLKKVRKLDTWQHPHVLIEDGAPNFLLRDYVRAMDVDLVVLGRHGRNAIVEMVVGSVGKAILDEVPCDVLVIPEPRADDEV